jgi:hypothetical protein
MDAAAEDTAGGSTKTLVTYPPSDAAAEEARGAGVVEMLAGGAGGAEMLAGGAGGTDTLAGGAGSGRAPER